MTIFEEHPCLLARFRAGQADALALIYRTYQPRVRRVASALLRTCPRLVAADVADLVQDTFERAFATRARLAYDGIRPYGDYLLAITRNRFVDQLRRSRRELLVAPVGEHDDPGDRSAMDPRRAALLEAALLELPSSTRRVCMERFVLGKSQSATALALGLTRARVRTAEHHAKRELRRALLVGASR